MERPTLQQLAYLVALGEHRHFGHAADACFVSQPALSNQIRELERRLGVTLVERTSRRVMLTPAGKAAAERAREVLRAVDELAEQARADGTGLTGVLRLGVIPTMAPYLLPRVVSVVNNHHPDAELHLRELRTEDLLDELRRGAIDLGLLALPLRRESGDVVAEPLAQDPFLLAVALDHPLARGRRPLDVSALAEHEVLLLEDGHCLRDQALDVCSTSGAASRTVHDTSLATLVQIVAGGGGVTLLPASAAPIEARPGNGVTTRPFRRPAPARTIGLVWRAASARDANYRELAELLKPELADLDVAA
jgi:LysR family hydrogen peroxide-inducible transcriptional activator